MGTALPKDGNQAWAMSDVLHERARQDRKWGRQEHAPELWLVILGEEYGEACQAMLTDRRTGEKRSGEYRKELVQIAAVALAAIECYDLEGGPE